VITMPVKMALAFLLLLGGNAPAQVTQQILQQGIRHYQAHEFLAAQRAFTQLVQVDPSARNYTFLALAEAAGGRSKEAILNFRKSIQLGDRTASAYYYLGHAYLQDHNPHAAIEQFQQALGLQPNYMPALYALGVAYLSAGDAPKAISTLEELQKQTPREPRVWAELANAQFQAGNPQQAAQTIDSAMQAFPANAQLAVTLASICIHHRQTQTARNLLEDAYEATPGNSKVRMMLGRVSLMAGEPVETLSVLRGMASTAQENPERLFLMGEAWALTGNLSAAATDFSTLIRFFPKDARYLGAYGWLELHQSDYQHAISTLNRAEALDSGAPWIPYWIGVGYYSMRRYPQVANACQEALRRQADFAPAYFLRGITKLDQKNFSGAAADLEKAVTLEPREALFRRELGVAFFRDNSLTKAKGQLDRAISLDRKDAAAYYWRARLLASEQAKREAIVDLTTAMAIAPHYSAAYTELARLYAETGQPAQAAKVLAEQKRYSNAQGTSEQNGLLQMFPDSAPR
jgi:tetratricopeptide (TPR) repeat protein